DFDFIHVLLHSTNPVTGLVDKRVSTRFVPQQILGYDKVHYDPILHIGFIAPCTKSALGELTTKLSALNFERSFGLINGAKLSMGFLPEPVPKVHPEQPGSHR